MTPREILEEVMERPLVLYHKDPVKLERLLRQALGKFQDKAGAILEVWGESGYFEIPANFQAVAGCCDADRRYVAWRFGEIEVVEEPEPSDSTESEEALDATGNDLEPNATAGGESVCGNGETVSDVGSGSSTEVGSETGSADTVEPVEISKTPDTPISCPFKVSGKCPCTASCSCSYKSEIQATESDQANVKKIKVIQLITKSKHVAPYCMYYFCDLRHWDLDVDLPPDCPSLIADYLEALLNLVNTQREREAYLSMGLVAAAQELPNPSELKQRIYDLEIEMQDNKALIPPASSF